MCVLVAQLCLTLCDLTDCSPPGFSVHGIPQGRILQWVDIPFSRGSSQLRDHTWISCNKGRSEPPRKPFKQIMESCILKHLFGFPGSSAGKESAYNVGDPGLIPGSKRSPGEWIGYPLQYSSLENSGLYSPWGPKESNMTEQLHFHFSLKAYSKRLEEFVKYVSTTCIP